MTELHALALKHGTDKSSHGYCPHYERFIGDMHLLPITMIELGASDGCSLRMWKEWMSKARIIGFDNADYNHPEDEITVFKGNQANIEDLQKMTSTIGRFHLVVDDASHQPKDQKVSFDYLWNELVTGGWYVIEDLDCQSISELNFTEHAMSEMIAARGNVSEFHLIAASGGSGILFLKKR